MRHRLFIAFCLLSFAIIFACQEDEEILYDEPNVRAVFYNYRYLSVVDTALVEMEMELVYTSDTLEFYADSAAVLLDSSIVLGRLVREGNDEYIPLLEEIIELQTEVLEKYNSVFTADSTIKVSRDSLEDIADDIESGNMVISSIENKKNNEKVEYGAADSSEVWRMPLSNTENDVSLAIEINENVYDLLLSYESRTTVDEYNNVVIQAYSIDTISHGFDSLRINCSTDDCIDFETTIDIYY
ncbi:MAG: hypothetical protein JXR07_11235 [Reichenbachiella sp.]